MGTGLLVVDVQNAVIEDVPDPGRFVEAINALVAAAREAGRPVVWVRHSAEDLPVGSEGWQIATGLNPLAGEPIVDKSHRSAFAETGLAEILRSQDVDHIVLTGAQSAFCVDMAGKHALAAGFDVTLVSDGHANGDQDTSDGTLSDAAVTALINRTWSTLRHPGSKVAVVASDALRW